MSGSSADLAVVIVNYNTPDDTEQAYHSLESSSYDKWTAVVLDNASSDDSVPRLKSAIKRGVVLENAVNTGFSGGCNRAIAHAIADGMRYILLLNNDTQIEPDAISHLIEASKKLDDSAILGCAVKFAETGKYQFFGSRTNPRVGEPVWFILPDHSEKLNQDLIETDFVYGAAMLIPTKVVEKVGLLNDRFFLNFEETDFCYRARKLGFLSYVVSSAIVYHKSGASLGSYVGPLQSYFLTRNRLLFCEMHGTKKQLAFAFLKEVRGLYRDVKRSLRDQKTFSYSNKSKLRGMIDYGLRRFGDCPTSVRRDAMMAKRAAE